MKKIMVIAILSMALLLSVIGCQKDTVTIEITTQPKTLYFVGEDFDKRGELTVTRSTKKDSSEEVVEFSDSRVSIVGFDSKAPAVKQEVAIKFENLEEKIEVDVVEATAVTISTMPLRTYGIDDPFNAGEGKLEVTLTNNGKLIVPIKDIPEGDIIGFDTHTPGLRQEVKIKYRNLETDPFYIDVKDNAIASISVAFSPEFQMEYFTNKDGNTKLNPTGATLMVKKAGASGETVSYALDSDTIKNDIKFQYDFTTRGINNVNKKVTVEYRGHVTTFDVDLKSKLERIEVQTAPKQTYIINEPFYKGMGLIRFVYEDGINESKALSEPNLFSASESFTTTEGAGELKYKIKYTHTDGEQYETPEISATVVDGGKASLAMAEYVKLLDVVVDWSNTDTDMDDSEKAIARAMYALFADPETNQTYLAHYRDRMISLKLAADYMEAYRDAKEIYSTTAGNVYNINTATDSFDNIINGFLQLLDTFKTEYDGFIEDLEAFNATYNNITLETNTTVKTIYDAIKAADGYRESVKTNINLVRPYYEGYKNIPNENVSSQKVVQFADDIDAMYQKIYNLPVTAKAELNSTIIPTLREWRADYVEIMLEHLYMEAGKTISGDIQEFLGKVDIDYLKEFDEVARLYYTYGIPYSVKTAQREALYTEMFTYSAIATSIVDHIYGLGYEAIIAVFEDYNNFNFTFSGSALKFVDASFAYVYDNMISYSRNGMYERLGSYYLPQGELKEFLDIFNPILKNYAGYVNDTNNYPSSVLFERDVLALLDAFYSLSPQDQAYAFHVFGDAFWLHLIVQSYYNTKLDSTFEQPVLNSYLQLEFYYLGYAANLDTSLVNSLISALAQFKSAYGGLSNKTNFNARMSHQLALVDVIDNWLAYYTNDNNWSTTKLISFVNAFRQTYNALTPETPKEIFAAFVRELDYYFDALSPSEVEELMNVAVFLPGEQTYYEFYLELKQIARDNLPIQDGGETLHEAYELYLTIIYKYAVFSGIYVPGYEEYDNEVQRLKELLFTFGGEGYEGDMDVDQLIFFVNNIVDVNYTPLFTDFLIPYGYGLTTEQNPIPVGGKLEKTVEKDAYLLLIQTIKAYTLYEAGRATFDDVLYALKSFKTAYDAIGNDTAKVDFNIFAELELDFIQFELEPFVYGIYSVTGDAELDAKISSLVSRITMGLATYRFVGNFLLMEGIVKDARATLNSMSESDRATALQTEMFMGADAMTLESFIQGLEDIYNSFRLISMSDDEDTKELFELLAVEVAIYHSAYRSRMGEEGFVINSMTMLEAYIDSNPEWTTKAARMLEIYMSMSSQQRGAFGIVQAGTGIETREMYQYFSFFVSEYLSYTLDPDNYTFIRRNTDNTPKTLGNIHNIVTSFVAAIDSYAKFQASVYPVSDTSDAKDSPRFIEYIAETINLYDKLTDIQRTAFDGMLGEYFEYYSELRGLLANRTGYLKMAIDNFSMAFDALEFSDSGEITAMLNDYSIFVKFYREARFAYNSLTDNDRLTFNPIRFKGHANEEKTLQNWMAMFDAIYRGNNTYSHREGSINSTVNINHTHNADGIEVFYKQYSYIASRFVDGYAGVDLLLFDTAFYPGEFMQDVKFILSEYAKLDDAQRADFLAIAGHTFKNMLRYYYASSLSLNEYHIWYDFIMATFDYHSGDTVQFASAMADIETRLADTEIDTTKFDEFAGEEYARYVTIYEAL